MLAVLVCLAFPFALFILLGLADRRWPDRLSRRGRFLAGIPEPRAAARQDKRPAIATRLAQAAA